MHQNELIKLKMRKSRENLQNGRSNVKGDLSAGGNNDDTSADDTEDEHASTKDALVQDKYVASIQINRVATTFLLKNEAMKVSS